MTWDAIMFELLKPRLVAKVEKLAYLESSWLETAEGKNILILETAYFLGEGFKKSG